MSWKFYSDPVFPIGDIMRAIKNVRYTKLWDNVVPSDSFLPDITNGNLASVSWVNVSGAVQRAPGAAEPRAERLRG